MPGEFRVHVYSKTFAFQDYADDYLTLTANPRHNAIQTAEFTMSPTSVAIPSLLADGARVIIYYRDEYLMSGQVRAKSGAVPWQTTPLTFGVSGYWLGDILGWPNPSGASLTSLGSNAYTVNGQGLATAYDERTGAAETVVKGFVTANATRLGLPLTVATDGARGDDITVSMRMHPLTDRLLPLVDQAGLGIDVRHVGSGLVVDVYEPTVRTLPLTSESGILRSGTWTRAAPTCTRVLVGGSGEGTAREFVLVVNPTLEAIWGKIEVFQDARDTDVQAEMIARGRERLAEGALKSGFSFDFGGGPGFQYGDTVVVGDMVPIEPVPGFSVTDVLREVTLTDAANGFELQSTVGIEPDPAKRGLDSFARSLAKAHTQLRDIEART